MTRGRGGSGAEVSVNRVLSRLWYSVYLRNKFHFSEVHRSMNATGHVQSK